MNNQSSTLSFLSKMKMAYAVFAGLFAPGEVDEKAIESLKEKEALEGALENLAKSFPALKETIINERDIYLSQKIRQSLGKKILAVVGAGHVPGIVREIEKETPLEPLMTLPSPSWSGRLIQWSVPAAIIGLLVYGFFVGGAKTSFESIGIWIAVTGSLTALGAAVALAHPLAVLTAFVAAPITTIHPLLAAGWFSGLVQAWIKQPTVADLEDLPKAIATIKGFWTNKVTRVLLVVVLSNLGGTLGTFVAGVWIAARSLSAH